MTKGEAPSTRPHSAPSGTDAIHRKPASASMQKRVSPPPRRTPLVLHITLAFLGELPEWESAAEALDTVEAEPGLLLLDRLDTFGKGGILGLCPTEDAPVRALAAKAERALREAGFTLEKRRFRAHVTLCRELTAPAGTELPPPPAVAVPVEEMVLFLSHRPKGKLTYTPLWRKKLG